MQGAPDHDVDLRPNALPRCLGQLHCEEAWLLVARHFDRSNESGSKVTNLCGLKDRRFGNLSLRKL